MVTTAAPSAAEPHDASADARPEPVAASLSRINALRYHRDKRIAHRVSMLHSWRVDKLAQCYSQLVKVPPQRALLEYYLRNIFCGIDLADVGNIDSAVNAVDRLFEDTALLQAALEYSALAAEINESLAVSLNLDSEAAYLTEDIFSKACRREDVWPKMARQITLLQFFFAEMTGLLSSRKMQIGLKLAKVPAQLYGFGDFHRLITSGLKVLKHCPDLDDVLSLFLKHERAIFDRIAGGQLPVFTPLNEA